MAQVTPPSVGRTRSGLVRPLGQKLHTEVSLGGQQHATYLSYPPHALDPDSNHLAPSMRSEYVTVLPSYGKGSSPAVAPPGQMMQGFLGMV